jgi:HK97 family phage portal protein
MQVTKSDQSLSPSYTSWHDLNSLRIRGMMGTKGTWEDYYQMYVAHPDVRAAIDKIARTATNAGYYFNTRDAQRAPNAGELTTLNTFFDTQPNLMKQLRLAYRHLMICGNAFLYIVTDRRRNPVKLKALQPKTMHVIINKRGDPVEYVQVVFQGGLGSYEKKEVRFKPNEIVHMTIEDPDSDVYGLSPLESLRHTIATDLFAQQYNRLFFQNSGVTGTIIAITNANPDEMAQNRAYLEENYTGPYSAHRPILIEGDKISITRSVANHTEMAFLDGRRYAREEILSVLDVPPAKLGIMETANRSNAREQEKAFRDTVSSLQSIVEDAINEKVVQGALKVKDMKFVHNPSDQQDAVELIDYYTKGEAFGIFSPNEIRTRLGYPETEGGDTLFLQTPVGAIPLPLLIEYARLPTPNDDPAQQQSLQAAGRPKPRRVDEVGRNARKALDDALVKKSNIFAAYAATTETENDKAISYIRKALDAKDDAAYRGFIELAKGELVDGL